MSKSKQLIDIMESKYIPKVGDIVKFTKEFTPKSKTEEEKIGKIIEILPEYFYTYAPHSINKLNKKAIDSVRVKLDNGQIITCRTDSLELVRQLSLFKEDKTDDRIKKTKEHLEKGLKNLVYDYIMSRKVNPTMAKNIRKNIDIKIETFDLDANTVYFYYGDPDKPDFKMPENLSERMISLTYGHLPDFDDFDKAFRKEVYNNTYSYNLKGSDSKVAEKVGIPGSGSFTSRELYDIIKKLTIAWEDEEQGEKGDYQAGDLAASFLNTLNFEWI